MALLPVAKTIQLDLIFLLHGQRVENVWHVTNNSGVDAQVLQDTAVAAMNWCTTSLMPLLANDIQFLGVEALNLDIPNGSKIAVQPPAPVAGGNTTPAFPGNVSFCVSLRTGFSGRSFRGRKYIPGIPLNVVNGDSVTSAFASDLIAAFNDLTQVMFAIGNFVVVVSRFANLVERLVPIATVVESYTTTDFFVDSQRRRLTGRGT
jgi:hypothetical protein